MKKYIQVFLALALVIGLNSTLSAQRAKEKTDKTSFTQKLWFGGGLGLGLSGNSFNFSLSPMVGYKLTNNISAGIRIPLDYNYVKLTGRDGTVINYNNLDFGVGTFGRVKFLRSLFAHVEYDHLWINEPVRQGNSFLLDPKDPTKLLTERNTEDQFHIGLGYNSSSNGVFGYEISLLYNVLDDNDTTDIPWSIRVGFNYKF